MNAAQHIEALLYRYQCVVVPSFGAFLTQIKPAFLQADSNTFFPPSKTVSFNSQLQTNDGLLVSHIAREEGKTYEEVLAELEQLASLWSRTLRREGTLRMFPLGIFRRNGEGKLLFEPEEKNNFLTASFGLSPVRANPVIREVLKEEVAEVEQRIPFTFTPERRKIVGLHPVFKYAAIALLALTAGVSAYTFNQDFKVNDAQVRAEAQKEVTRQIQEATFFSNNPLELPTLTLEVVQEEAPAPEIFEARHHIIAGAFRVRANAEKKIRQLKRRGFDARYIGENAYGLHQVAYGSYVEAEEALEKLKEIKQQVSQDAWLLSQR
ncbi:Sporulation related domain-containing protein [Robiginitalea myxolifaciens]|uniref:Sporulation related domain-containing protein n=1 Tax=Robiginitalea myxolifaciens TaxID=400055 RepID=A0A1I6G1P2_9FLAO|nr:SPOR domain-containing protein [Robiginitalea myxolifaciens]SFR36105.1 Sporulation related domain-containing protein [Robiginitalea myxolifaciens]